MQRLVIGAVLLGGCYFETPTHSAEDAGGAPDESDSGPEDAGMDAESEQDDAQTAPEDSAAAPICACDAGAPICIEATATCVECTEPSHCTAQAPACRTSRCVGCSVSADCSGYASTPACRPSDGKCVECTAESATACKGSTPVCDAANQKCVACNANTDCKDSTKPICDNHQCRPCTSKADCASQSKVCRVDTGACVDCVPDKDNPEQENCPNGNACNPMTFTCSGAQRNKRAVCTSCISDSECVMGARCLATQFKGNPRGMYCLIEQMSDDPCMNRYRIKRSATSVLNVTANYCFPDEALTTCEAISEYGTLCPNNPSECGANDLTNDALCKDGSCTYPCGSDRDCPSGAAGSCFTDSTSSYCK